LQSAPGDEALDQKAQDEANRRRESGNKTGNLRHRGSFPDADS
jgi:hypothetical protein